MHHIYHTEALILGSQNFGENGKYYSLFTRDMGLILARAEGVRNISSKLRYVLVDYSHAKIDLVLGRNIWRITSASKSSMLQDIRKNKPAFQIFSNLSRLLKRLLPGEEANQALYDDVLEGLKRLEAKKERTQLEAVEALSALRILARLGYIGEGLAGEIAARPWGESLIGSIESQKSKIISLVNKALRETHL